MNLGRLGGLARRLWPRSRAARYLIVVLAGSLVLAAAGLVLAAMPVKPGSTETVVFEIKSGEGASTIASNLQEQGLVRFRHEFRLLSAVLGWNGRLKSGRYEMSPGLSTWAILRKIGRGEVVQVPLTVPEGYTLDQIRDLLVEKGWATKESFDQALASLDAAGELPFLPVDRHGLVEPYEGVLFPSTYFFESSATPGLIVRTMARTTTEVFTPELRARATEIGMTPWQVLTLASIIEEEAATAEERPIISSVYHNRLRIGMAMESCPTVLYAVGKPWGSQLLFTDLDVVSPYNTYRNPGLPPGPIASPGLASIKAALYPAETDYFYFVSRNDGTNQFSRTFAEHQRAIAKYQGGS